MIATVNLIKLAFAARATVELLGNFIIGKLDNRYALLGQRLIINPGTTHTNNGGIRHFARSG